MISKNFFLGIDLGGTKVRLAVADTNGKILHEIIVPTKKSGAVNLLEQVVTSVNELCEEAALQQKDLIAIGIGAPGVANNAGYSELSANVNALATMDLATAIAQVFGCPVFADNDANLAALGEFVAGAGKGLNSLVTISIGTGIGAGIILAGQVHRGHRGYAGEIAFIPSERFEKNPDVKTYGATEMEGGTVGLMAHANSKYPQRFANVEAIFESASDGDDRALSLVQYEAQLIARVVAAIQSVLDPELFVLTGGIGANHLLSQQVPTLISEWLPYPVAVISSALGIRAGVIGAIELAVRGNSNPLLPRPMREMH